MSRIKEQCSENHHFRSGKAQLVTKVIIKPKLLAWLQLQPSK